MITVWPNFWQGQGFSFANEHEFERHGEPHGPAIFPSSCTLINRTPQDVGPDLPSPLASLELTVD